MLNETGCSKKSKRIIKTHLGLKIEEEQSLSSDRIVLSGISQKYHGNHKAMMGIYCGNQTKDIYSHEAINPRNGWRCRCTMQKENNHWVFISHDKRKSTVLRSVEIVQWI